MTKNPLFFTIHNKNEALLSNFKSKWPYPETDQSIGNPPIVYNDNEPTRVQTCDEDTSYFPGKPASR